MQNPHCSLATRIHLNSLHNPPPRAPEPPSLCSTAGWPAVAAAKCSQGTSRLRFGGRSPPTCRRPRAPSWPLLTARGRLFLSGLPDVASVSHACCVSAGTSTDLPVRLSKNISSALESGSFSAGVVLWLLGPAALLLATDIAARLHWGRRPVARAPRCYSFRVRPQRCGQANDACTARGI